MNEREPGDIVRVLEYYGSTEAHQANDRSGWVSIRCPWHSDRVSSAGLNASIGAFNCLGCGIKGDSLSLIMKVETCDFPSALRRYEEIVGGSHPGVSKSVRGQSRGFDLLGRTKRFEQGSGFSFTNWLRRDSSTW